MIYNSGSETVVTPLWYEEDVHSTTLKNHYKNEVYILFFYKKPLKKCIFYCNFQKNQSSVYYINVHILVYIWYISEKSLQIFFI